MMINANGNNNAGGLQALSMANLVVFSISKQFFSLESFCACQNSRPVKVLRDEFSTRNYHFISPFSQEPGDPRLWAHLLTTYAVSFATFVLLWRAYSQYTCDRHRFIVGELRHVRQHESTP